MARLLYSDSQRPSLRAGPHYHCYKKHISLPTGRFGTSREEVCGGSGTDNQCQTPFRPPPARVAQGLDTFPRAKKRSSRSEAEGMVTGHSKLSGKPYRKPVLLWRKEVERAKLASHTERVALFWVDFLKNLCQSGGPTIILRNCKTLSLKLVLTFFFSFSCFFFLCLSKGYLNGADPKFMWQDSPYDKLAAGK